MPHIICQMFARESALLSRLSDGVPSLVLGVTQYQNDGAYLHRP